MRNPLIVSLALAVSPAAFGQAEPAAPYDTVHVRFAVGGGGVGRIWTDSTREGPLDAVNSFLLRPRTRVRLRIENPNPLLFNYTLVKRDPVPTENAGTIAALAKLWGPLFPTPRTGEERAFDRSQAGECQQSHTLTMRDKPVFGLQNACLRDFEEALVAVHELAESIPSLVKDSATDPAATRKRALEELDRVSDPALDSGLAAIREARHACFAFREVSVTTATGTSEAQCWSELREYVALVLSYESELKVVRASLRAFRDAVVRIGEPIDLEPSVVYSAVSTQPLELTVTRAAAYEKLVPGADLGPAARVLGTYQFVFKPRERVRLRLLPALVYGLVRVPEFEAVKQGEGLTIRETAREYSKEELAAMLTVTPEAWADSAFAPHLQLGITPGKDKTAFYVGVGFAATRVSFGLGLLAREVPRLADGLAPGAPLSSPDELKTVNHFKTGLYFQLGLVP